MTRFGLVLMLLVLAGCARGGAASPAAGPPWGHTYLSTAVTEQGKPRQLAAGTRIELRFAGGRLVVRAGCNTMQAQAQLEGDWLVVGEMSVTAMACLSPLGEQDVWVATFLGGRPVWRLTGDELVLDGAGISITLLDREIADPDRLLVGAEWTVDTLILSASYVSVSAGASGAGAAASVPAGVRAHLTFTAGGEVTGSGGCNSSAGRTPWTARSSASPLWAAP